MLKMSLALSLDSLLGCGEAKLAPCHDVVSRLLRDQEFSIPGFPGWDFAKSRDPRIFRDRISLKLYPGILPKKYGISLSAHKFGQFHTFWRTFLFVKYIRQTKVSSIPSCGKQQERAGVQCCWQRGDPKKSLPHTRESRSLSYCQIQPWSVKRHGLSK